VISDRLRSIVRCPECGGTLEGPASDLSCQACRRRYGSGGDFLDLRPHQAFEEQTKYLDEALHADGRHARVSPPLLSAGVRHEMLRRFLQPGPGDAILDLGCGSGRELMWNVDAGAYLVGVDVSPFFAAETRAGVDLLVGDLRRLPVADGAFTKAFALDVWEHLSREGLDQVLRETARVVAPGGQVFVYSHVRKNSRLALGLRAINRFARFLDRIGAIDLTQERLRKSDHLNPLADLDDLRQATAAAGFRIARIRYYTPLIGGFVENILARLAERALGRRSGRPAATTSAMTADNGSAARDAPVEPDDSAARVARSRAKARLARRGPLYHSLVAVTWLMKLDVALFGRVPSGPFFALLVKDGGDHRP